MSVHRTLSIAIVACAAACASGGQPDTLPPQPVTVEVDNNLPLPTQLTVYAVTEAGIRTLLGDVPPARTGTLQFTPTTYSTAYRFLAIFPNGRRFVSQRFIVGSRDTGRLVWTLVPNIIGFRGPDITDTTVVDSAARRDTTRHSPPPAGPVSS